jgi:LPXTG-site transpeptidase (sortase) family protein
MIYLILRITANIVILSGLLLATFGFGAAVGKTVQVFTAPVPQPAAAGIPHLRAQSNTFAQVAEDLQKPAPDATVTPADEKGFVPYRIPIPDSGGSSSEGEAAPVGSEPQAPPQTPKPPAIPDRIVIPQIGLDAPVVLAPIEWVKLNGVTYEQWEAPKTFAAGWQEGSAAPGQAGNFVLIGHHNIDGKVFGHLVDLKEGDAVAVYSGTRLFGYYIRRIILLEEREASLLQRQENAMWIRPTADERLTLVTCWPPESNTYRLIIVAQPAK